MYLSGVVTGKEHTVAVHKLILQVQPLALSVCFVAVAGTAQLRAVAVLIATTALRPTGTATSVFVSPCSEFFCFNYLLGYVRYYNV